MGQYWSCWSYYTNNAPFRIHHTITALSHQLDSIRCRSYIAKSQAIYLSELKENLEEYAIIVLGDFAEKYSIVIQD